MTKSLLLLDADVTIDFHGIGYWKGILANYSLHVGSVVANEVEHYVDAEKNKIIIDLRQYISRNEITELNASAEEMSVVSEELKDANLGLDAGELECIAILKADKVPGLKLCLIDQAAIKAVSYLGLESKSVSVEEVLVNCGILRQKSRIARKHSKKRAQAFVAEGKMLAVEKGRQ